MDGSVKVVKVDEKPFVVTSNITNALLYIEDLGPVTFLAEITRFIILVMP